MTAYYTLCAVNTCKNEGTSNFAERYNVNNAAVNTCKNEGTSNTTSSTACWLTAVNTCKNEGTSNYTVTAAQRLCAVSTCKNECTTVLGPKGRFACEEPFCALNNILRNTFFSDILLSVGFFLYLCTISQY